jgi:CHRD domain
MPAIAASLAAAICAHPEDYYVNYHTTAFPGGAIRGQQG